VAARSGPVAGRPARCRRRRAAADPGAELAEQITTIGEQAAHAEHTEADEERLASEFAQARIDAAATAARADAELSAARAQLEQTRADLSGARAEASTNATRAATAEAQLGEARRPRK